VEDVIDILEGLLEHASLLRSVVVMYVARI
jgi:hypothetical protein